MAQIISTNSFSLITQNNIDKDQSALPSSIEHLSSGLHINSTRDDAAGQAIADRFTSNIKGLTQAARNANNGISVIQTIEGVLSGTSNNLQRIRELTVQVSIGTNSDSGLDSIQDEIRPRLDEINRVSGQAQFNGVNVLAKDGPMKVQVGVNDGGTVTIDLKRIDSDTLDLNDSSVDDKDTITNRVTTVNDLTSAGAKLNATTSLYDLKTKNTLLTTDAAFDKLGNGDKAVVGGIDYTYNARSDDLITTRSIADTGVDVATQATDLAKKRDVLAATLHVDVGKSVNDPYTTKGGTVSFETDSAGNIAIGGSQVYVNDANNLTTNNAGNAAKADMKVLLKTASEGNDGASLTLNGTEYTIVKATPATTSPVAPLIPNGTIYQATVSKDVVLSETKAVAATSSIAFNSGVLDKTIGSTTGESSDAVKSYVDDKGGTTNVANYTVSYSVSKDNGSVIVAGYALATDTNRNYAPAIGTVINMNFAGEITIEATSAGSATTNPLAALDDVINPINKFRSSLGAIRSRLDSTVTNLNNTTANLSEARSRIQGTNYATGASNTSKAQIIQQAGNSVLAKVNQVPQQVLSLLQG